MPVGIGDTCPPCSAGETSHLAPFPGRIEWRLLSRTGGNGAPRRADETRPQPTSVPEIQHHKTGTTKRNFNWAAVGDGAQTKPGIADPQVAALFHFRIPISPPLIFAGTLGVSQHSIGKGVSIHRLLFWPPCRHRRARMEQNPRYYTHVTRLINHIHINSPKQDGAGGKCPEAASDGASVAETRSSQLHRSCIRLWRTSRAPGMMSAVPLASSNGHLHHLSLLRTGGRSLRKS